MAIGMEKEFVFETLTNVLEERYRSMQAHWDILMESNQQEGKSSAGDKHETGTAMVHLELQQLGRQVEELRRQLEEVYTCRPENNIFSGQVSLGSLVTTDVGLYYMITGFGKLQCVDQEVYVIGRKSPAGKALWGKVVGDRFEWGRVTGEVISIV